MATQEIQLMECPICHTIVCVHLTYGIYPAKTQENANCPVCLKLLFSKNTTGDIETEVESTESTIEPYKSDYTKTKGNEIKKTGNE